MIESEVYPTFLKITGEPIAATAALLTLNEAVQDLGTNKVAIFLQYAEGYKHWLLAGLGTLNSEQLAEIGGNHPAYIVSAFRRSIEAKRELLGDAMRRLR